MIATLLIVAVFAQVDTRPVIVDHVTALEINRVVSRVDGSEEFSMLIVWRGREIICTHFWRDCGAAGQFGHVIKEDADGVEIFINSLKGPRLLVASTLKRSTTFESIELQYARNSPNGRQRLGLTLRK